MKKLSGEIMLLLVFFLVTTPVVADGLELSNTNEMFNNEVSFVDESYTDALECTIISNFSLVTIETKTSNKEEVAEIFYFCEIIDVLISSTKQYLRAQSVNQRNLYT